MNTNLYSSQTIVEIKKENSKQQNLVQNLSQFGLCPFDWTLVFETKDSAIIKNSTEPEFQFIGRLNKNKTDWEYIKLLSL